MGMLGLKFTIEDSCKAVLNQNTMMKFCFIAASVVF